MTDDRRGRKKVAGPLLLSTLAHIALLVPLSIPGCSISQQSEDQPERPKEPDALTVDLLDEPPSQQSKPSRLKGEICDPNAPAEYHYFDIKPGPAIDRIYHAARLHYGEIIMGVDSLAGKQSRALRGWFRPFDAVRLLAGDAGLCAVDLREGIGINYCDASDALFSRSNETWARQEREPHDCTGSIKGRANRKLDKAREAMDRTGKHAAQDMERAYRRDPALASEASVGRVRQAMRAMQLEAEIRVDPDKRADRFVEGWRQLHTHREELQRDGDFRGARKVSEQMAGMAKSLERDAQMESVLRGRKQELGIGFETGRQLSHDLASSVGIEMGRGRDLGMSR